MLTIHCQCGEVFHAEERHIGRVIKCWRCGQVLGIGAMPPTSPGPGFMASRTSTEPSMASGRRSFHRWGIAALALVVVVIAATILLSPRERIQQQPIARPPISQPPAEVVSRPAPEPLPPPPTMRPAPGARFVLKPEPAAPKAKLAVPRLKTGTNIRPPLGASGRGTLRINNGTNYDAAVTLLDEENNTARRFVYIRAREATTLSAIAPCQCRLFFALGTDWDAPAEEFREDSRYSVFDDPLRFKESETDDEVKWATFSVTLHPVPEGKAKTTRLSKEEFERRLGKRHSLRGV